MITLEVTKRETSGTSGARGVRRAGFVPGIVYGAHKEPTPVSVEVRAFDKVLREAGESSIVMLEGVGAAITTLIHEVDLDPVTHRPRHIDFYAVTKGEKVEVAVPINFVNESPAVKAGANLVKVLHELEIKADPMSLPHDVEVDLAALAVIGDQIHAGDLKLPAGVELMIDAEEVIALVQEIEEEKGEMAAADISVIEVEKKGKEEGSGEAKAE